MLMPLKRIATMLWVAVAVLAGAFFLTSDDSGYREYTTVTVAAPVVAQVEVPGASRVETLAPAAPSSVSTTPSAPSLSLAGVSDLLANVGKASAPPSSVAKSLPDADKRKDEPVASSSATNEPQTGLPKSWRTASTVSATEVEAAVKDAEMTDDTAHAFRAACKHDHSLKFDSKGQPLYACAMKIQVGPDTTPMTTAPSYPLAQTFLLHSRPTATRKIYLDFDGHTTSGTPWNASWRGGADFTTPAFSSDGSPAFTDAEKAIVQETFRRVAEHFAPWDVDVTTQDPGVEGLRKIGAGDLSYGIRVVIGPDVNATGAGGIAYLNSFDDSIDTPCFVFTGAGSSASYVAGVTSHEVGHTVSLVHQGQNPGTGEYFSGHGTGALSWSPIMGNGLRPVNQWAKGQYLNATSTQDNVVAIANVTSGVPFATDDHADTLGSATVMPGVSVTGGGVISSASDFDLFKFTAGRGNVVITPKVSLVAPNLRLHINVLNSAGTVLASFSGVGTAGSMAPDPITFFAPAGGVYYLEFYGIGNGDGITSGYTDYGSIGIYSFVASWQDFIQKPVAAITSDRTGGVRPVTVAFDGGTSSDPDGVVVGYSWNFGDPASASANTSTLRNPSHTYAAPGAYTATLVVTDNQGNVSAAATQVITVTGSALPNSVHVGSMTGSWVRRTNVEVAGTAIIRAVNQYGQPLRHIAVYVTVTGSASGKSAAKTDANGYITIQMPKQRSANPSTYTFTVTRLVYPGYPYVAADNLPLSGSVTITR